ncbi:hypothetical protein HIC20_01470 [Buchnera aphidicola (Hormaphis cornu)]|nr:hypothetical protein HIC20_01470 [Buchnera aphidicola (Hormaphis cornu)]
MLRLKFLNKLQIAIQNNNLFILLSMFNENNFEQLINWIYLLLIDAIKYKYKIYQYLINIDQKKLIKQLSNSFSYQSLEYSIKSWIQCKNKLIFIPEINIQLIILEQLLRWEKILNLNI